MPTNTPRTAPLTGTQTAVSRLECTLAEPDVVRAYQFVTANDNTKRDPLDWQIYRRDQTPRPDGQGGFEVPPGGSPHLAHGTLTGLCNLAAFALVRRSG